MVTPPKYRPVAGPEGAASKSSFILSACPDEAMPSMVLRNVLSWVKVRMAPVKPTNPSILIFTNYDYFGYSLLGNYSHYDQKSTPIPC